MKILKSHHRTRDSFYLSMILLDDIIQVLALSNPDPLVILIILFDSSGVSTTLIDVDQTWLFISTNRFG